MTEREVNTGEQQPQQIDMLEVAKRIDEYLKHATQKVSELAKRRFDTEEAAEEAGDSLHEELITQGANVDHLNRLPVQISGEDVRVSNVKLETSDEGIVTASVGRDEPYVAVDFFDPQPIGTLYDFVSSVEEDEQGFVADIYAIFEDTKSPTVPVSVGGLPIAEINITQYVFAPLSSSELTIPLLEQYETRSRALSQVVFRKIEAEQQNRITGALEAIKTALDESGVKREFVPFTEVEQFHRLAKITDELVDVATVLDALRDIFGKGRPIDIKGDTYIGLDSEAYNARVRGVVIDFLPHHEALGIAEPTIVVETLDEGAKKLVYVPLSHIEEAEF